MSEEIRIPGWFFEIATQVQHWLLKPELRERFWQFSHEAAGVDRQAVEDHNAWREARQEHIEKLHSLDENNPLRIHTKVPPEKGYAWDFENFPYIDGEPTNIYCIEGWFPLQLHRHCRPSNDICLDRPEPLSLAAKYYILSACHDLGCPQEPKLLSAEDIVVPHDLDENTNAEDPDDLRRICENVVISMPITAPYYRLEKALAKRLSDHPEKLKKTLETLLISVTDDVAKLLKSASESGGETSPHLDPVEKALNGLLYAVEKHRLTFLYFVEAWRRNPMTRDDDLEKVTRDDRPEFGIPVSPGIVDSEGEFLLEYRYAMDAFALAAMDRFGTGEGSKPVALTADREWVEIEGGGLPVWQLGEGGDFHLNESADAVLAACRSLAEADTGRHLRPLIQEARALTHHEGQARWQCSNLVRWEYLTKLDELILSLKLVDVGHGEAPTPGPEVLPPAERTDEECDGAPKIKPAQANAFKSYEWVARKHPELVPSEDIRSWYSPAMYDIAIGKSGVYEEREAPSYGTWVRYLRAYKQAVDGPKNTSRVGRGHGGSIVGADHL